MVQRYFKRTYYETGPDTLHKTDRIWAGKAEDLVEDWEEKYPILKECGITPEVALLFESNPISIAHLGFTTEEITREEYLELLVELRSRIRTGVQQTTDFLRSVENETYREQQVQLGSRNDRAWKRDLPKEIAETIRVESDETDYHAQDPYKEPSAIIMIPKPYGKEGFDYLKSYSLPTPPNPEETSDRN